MPTFVFTDPSGKTHEVKGPPGATQEQAFKMLQQSMGGGGGATAAQAGATAAQAPKAPKAPEYDPTEGMGWGEKALVNLGAGIDTTWQGAKQLFGHGMSDEDLAEKRRIDKHLADKTTGGGLIQTAGEILPTIPLGMGAAAGARYVGGALASMAASPTLAAAGGGAMGGALQPVMSDESRLQNMGIGAAGGAVAPHLLKLAVGAGRGARNVAQRAAAALPGEIGERAAGAVGQRGAGQTLARELEGGIGPDVYTPHPFIRAEGGAPSAAVATQDPRLIALERGSRTKAGEEWMPHDVQQARAQWKAMDTGLQGQADVDRLLGEADVVGSKVPYQAVGNKAFNKGMDEFYTKLQQAKNSAAYRGTPAVKSAVDWVENSMNAAGQVTPEHLHKMRQTISKGLTGVPGAGEQGVRAAASEPFVISLSHAMDDVLDASSKGKWSGWKGDYATAMQKAEGAKADVNIRGKFVDPATGVPLKPVAGLDDVPVLKPQALKQAIAQAGSMKRGPRKGQPLLSTGSEDVLQGVLRDVEAGEALQRGVKSSTAGGGSATASNMSQAALMEMFLPSGLGISNYVRKEGGRKSEQAMQRELARLLQDPAALRQILAAQARAQALRGQAPAVQGLGAGAGTLLLGGPEQ